MGCATLGTGPLCDFVLSICGLGHFGEFSIEDVDELVEKDLGLVLVTSGLLRSLSFWGPVGVGVVPSFATLVPLAP